MIFFADDVFREILKVFSLVPSLADIWMPAADIPFGIWTLPQVSLWMVAVLAFNNKGNQ